jgi:hypothetical protein
MKDIEKGNEGDIEQREEMKDIEKGNEGILSKGKR